MSVSLCTAITKSASTVVISARQWLIRPLIAKYTFNVSLICKLEFSAPCFTLLGFNRTTEFTHIEKVASSHTDTMSVDSKVFITVSSLNV